MSARKPLVGAKSNAKKQVNRCSYLSVFKNIDDALWKDAGCSSELDYIEQTSWILFLNIWTTLNLTRKSRQSLMVKLTNALLVAAIAGQNGLLQSEMTAILTLTLRKLEMICEIL